MKLISFIVPCYNSVETIHRCIDSLLVAADQAEIIIINDGSTDRTPVIADEYKQRYPDIVKVIHQENRGHGGAINAGLSFAEGRYLRVVDSDDWLDASALKTVLERLSTVEDEGGVDLLISNYCYYRKDKGIEKIISYKRYFSTDVIGSWDDVSVWKMCPWHQFMIHSLTFRTDIIRDSGLLLPEKIFYEDNYMLYYLFLHCQRIMYTDVDLYLYFIGREGQSMSTEVLLRRNGDERKIAEMCWTLVDLDVMKKQNKKLYHILYRELWVLLSSAILFTRLPRTKAADDTLRQFCKRLKTHNKKYYRRFMIRNRFFLLVIPGRFGRFLALDIFFRIAHAFVGFN